MKKSFFLLFFLLVISVFFHSYNVLHFPFFENDEGTYMAQAWSFISEGKLAPYTYWYDHAPFGWIFISLWIVLTGGLFTFGFSLNSARIFMFLIHVVNTILLFYIGKKITKSDVAVFFTILFFSVSPLAVYFQRRLLLDNLMIFWIFVSLSLIISQKRKLRYFIVSAVTFGFSVLTKENAIFFLPVLGWLVIKESHSKHTMVAFVKWMLVAGAVISIYPLYAFLKGEFFPEGFLLSPPYPHVSLLETLKMHAGRGTGLPFWKEGSDFRISLMYWLGKDALLIISGYFSFIFHGIFTFFSKKSKKIFLLTLPMILFLISGGLVISFYIVPLIPFLGLSIGLLISYVYDFLRRFNRILSLLFLLGVTIFLGWYYFPRVEEYLTRDETSQQKKAVEWIKKNIDPDSKISIDFYSYLDLSESRYDSDSTFGDADWFWKIELDEDIREDKLNNDFRELDYVMLTAEVQRQLKGYPEKTSILRNFLAESEKVAEFSFQDNFDFELQLFEQKYPNGDWVVIYKQKGFNFEKNWNTYKNNFLDDEGFIRNPGQQDIAISEAQAYALLRSVWMDDKDAFEKIYFWTSKYMLLEDNNLFGWKWSHDGKKLIDEGNAPDADQNIALALIFASRRWNNPLYETEAKSILKDIWKLNVFEGKDEKILGAGNWANNSNYLTINPSYFSPYAYRIFAEVDKEDDWMKLVDSSYNILEKCTQDKLDKEKSVFLPPEWCRYNKKDGSVAISVSPQPESSDYAFNAFRIPWKIHLDYQWNDEKRAINYLNSMYFIFQEFSEGRELYDIYSHDGEPLTQGKNYSYLMNLPVIMIKDKNLADEIVQDKIIQMYSENEDGLYWLDGEEYYLENWAWFAMGYYEGKFNPF